MAEGERGAQDRAGAPSSAVAVLDRSGRVIALGRALAARLGVDPGQAEGRPWSALLGGAPHERERIETWLDRARRAGAAELDAAPTPGGTPLALRAERLDPPGWLLLRAPEPASPVHAAAPDGMGAETDAILRELNSALLVIDADGHVVLANPTAERILGEPAGGLVGRAIWDWFPDRPREEVAFARTLRDGARLRGEELVLTRADGQRVPIGVSCAPLRDAAGGGLGAVATFQDLSETKQIQRQALQAEKMASIGQLAAGIAHEINNPMGFIHANLCQVEEYLRDLAVLWQDVEALRKAAGTGDAGAARAAADALEARARELDAAFLLDDAAQAVRESQEGAERIRHIVQDLRAFSHQDDGEAVHACVNECLDSTAHIAWAMMKHHVELEKRYADLPPVRCRPMQLKQVFMNLLLNAHQAIDERLRAEGGGRGTIVLETARCEEGVRIVVEDDGVGLPAGQAHRIFEPFFTTKPVGVGVGLGLATSYTLVRGHGGTLRAYPRPGGGAVFEVRLPLDAAAPGEGGGTP